METLFTYLVTGFIYFMVGGLFFITLTWLGVTAFNNVTDVLMGITRFVHPIAKFAKRKF